MSNQLKQYFTPEKIQKLKTLFLYHDSEMKGYVDTKNLSFMLRAYGILISDKEIKELQVSTKISEEEFYQLIIKLKDKKPVKSEIQASVQVFDQNNTGFVDTKELMGIVQQMGDQKVEKEFQMILNKLSNQHHQVPIESLINQLLKE